MREADPASEIGVEIRLLGPLDVVRDGRLVALGGPKPSALLAALALEPGRVLSIDRLIDDLWPGGAPETAVHAVEVYVSQLRRALGPDAIRTRTPGYVLALDEGVLDTDRFARLVDEGRAQLEAGDFGPAASVLREALGLWRGPALADFVYEPFAQTGIARLEELRRVALEARVDADLGLGRHVELVPELEALLQAEPLREPLSGQLMVALYRSGRQTDALAAYRRARAALLDQLGIEPGPQLKGLEAAILRQDASLMPEHPTARAMQFRRLVTALSLDRVGSSAYAEQADPETVEHAVRTRLEALYGVITVHGGTVEQATGDTVTALFGVPVSHEDDVLRATHAALEIRDALGGGLGLGMGIETGEVVVAPADPQKRSVTGEVVAVAAALGRVAGDNEIVLGEVAGRLIAHAAALEPLAELELRGRSEPVGTFRLLDVPVAAPVFQRVVDAPFVGRRRELAALRRALKRAAGGTAARAVVVAGAAGVGKSRLAAEFARRAKHVTVFQARCLSYEDGITYWPLREIIDQAGEHDDTSALREALDDDPPPPPAELALAFRRFCEHVARRRPLVLVLDDLHWAEPTFLELVEHVAARGEAPILVVCLAREELLDDRPEFLAGSGALIRLDALPPDDTEALLGHLGGVALELDRRARMLEAAEGNPFFLEQLLALALEGGAEQALPESIQALLAARLDRLGPGERAVLERGSVVGREFGADEVIALLHEEAAGTVPAHLGALSRRGLLVPIADGAFRFRHALVREAVYRAAPKRLRAELHERHAEWLDSERPAMPELDEFVGYHLEQAHQLRADLGEDDDRARTLADEAARRLGTAGVHALRREDMPAARSLLERSTSLLPRDAPLRRQLLCELALVLVAVDDSDAAADALTEAAAAAEATGDAPVAARSRIELEYIRLRHEPQRTADALLAAATEGIPVFQRARDRRGLGRAWLLAGFVRGGHRGNHRSWQEAGERALRHYRAAGWPISTCVGEIAAALYWGPVHVNEAARRCEALLNERLDLPGSAYLRVFLGGLAAQHGDFARGRRLVESARATLEELGLRAAAETYCLPVLGEIELLAGDSAAAEAIFRKLCDQLERAGDVSHLASRASDLAEALVEEGRFEEAEAWTSVAETHAARDDLDAQMRWRPVRARALAARGRLGSAEELAREAVRLADATDDLNRRGRAQRSLAEVLLAAGQMSDAASAFQRAVELYDEKGNVAAVARLRSLRTDLMPA